MRSIARRWRTVLLAVPVVGALGFGAGQALATPAPVTGGERECFPDRRCWTDCPYAGGTVVYLGCMCCEYRYSNRMISHGVDGADGMEENR